MDGSETNGGGHSTGLHDQLKFLKEEVEYNRNKIIELESRLSGFDPPQRTYSAAEPTAQTVLSDDTDATELYLTVKKTIPEVRQCSFAEFKNRFEPHGKNADGKDGRYAVDVLVSGSLLHQEIHEERRLRDLLFEQNGPSLSSRKGKDKALAKAIKQANSTADLISKAQSNNKWPRRIRIQAPVLLRILAKVNRENWSDRPRTYYRPFNSLIFQHEKIKMFLQDLEERWASELDARMEFASDVDDPLFNNEELMSNSHEDEDEDSVDDSPDALACLRAYVKYIDENIITEYRQFEDKDVSSNVNVRFSDLWYLFRTGEFVYRQVDGELPDRRDFRTGKRIWKTYYVNPLLERMIPTAADNPELKETLSGIDDSAFILGCYYVDYTGDEFCVVTQEFKIEQFLGEKPVASLPIYPIRFCRDWELQLDHAKGTGDSMIQLMKEKHCFYNSWTLTRSPGGDPTSDAKGVPLTQPEHINSEVMVDFGEAFQACPHWKPQRDSMPQQTAEGMTVQEDFRIRWWSGKDRASLLGETSELSPVKTGVVQKERNTYISEDPFLKTISGNVGRGQQTTEKNLTDDAKVLLTGRMFAYVFSERKFAQLSVAKLRPSPKTGLALDSLKIPDSVKDAVQGSVQGHFLQKAAERKIGQDWISLDLIHGKGTGLFILLHGVPGVGKTATAEAIAQANGKPLFKITVGDLGMTPEKLELSLREIFRLASIWDCILLLDEVDTFFSERSRADTATDKNAMVSVFLRVLDYYNGILFLTTNRAGVLDEAFKSRIHYKIYYPHLTLEQTLDIWRLNIQRVHEIEETLAKVENRDTLLINEKQLLDFARHHFNEGANKRRGHPRWNGRQIRNAFQVACSLAYYDYNKRQNERPERRQSTTNTKATGPRSATDDLPNRPILTIGHFETMHEITASFDNYVKAIHGGITDAQRAEEAEVRLDNYQDPLTENWKAEYRELHHRPSAAETGDEEEIDYNTSDTALPFPSLVTVNQQRNRHISVGDAAPAENYLSHEGRGSYSSNSRSRSGSFNPNVSAGSPQNVGFNTAPRPIPTSSPRPSHRRDTGSGGFDLGTNYTAAGQPRTGYLPPQSQTYSRSPRNSAGNIHGYQPPSQYSNEGGGMGEPRGGYYGSSDNALSPTGREGPGMLGASGTYARGWSAAGAAGGQGYPNQYAGHGRDQGIPIRQGPNVETDLSPDESSF